MITGATMPERDSPQVVNLQSMILCDSISRDTRTDDVHLHGLIDAIYTDDVPLELSFAVYVIFSEQRGPVAGNFRITDAEGNVIAESAPFELPNPADPLLGSEMIEHLDVEFPSFGIFFVQLWMNNRYIMERRVTLESADTEE
jgi:hypothetical protein